jgi:Protein of unknown function (DUF1549)
MIVAINTYEKVVDRLLASPRYGERMAMQWLDLARYADTHGDHIDSHREMWHWRDWVIDAFNRNMPFDEFTIEQLAGDLLPHPTLAQRIATGFNRNHMINFEGGAIPEEYQNECVVDRLEATSVVWLGTTMGCARCHINRAQHAACMWANGCQEPAVPSLVHTTRCRSMHCAVACAIPSSMTAFGSSRNRRSKAKRREPVEWLANLKA